MECNRFFKKVSVNAKIAVYISSRDVLHSEKGDSFLDGVVMLGPDFARNQRVFGRLVLVFRYGKEDDEILGLTFSTEIMLDCVQIYPLVSGRTARLTSTQELLQAKLGTSALPFRLRLSQFAPPSVVMRPNKKYLYDSQPLGISYLLQVYTGESETSLPYKKSNVWIGVRKLLKPPTSCSSTEQPSTSITKPLFFSEGSVSIEVVLDKAAYNFTETIPVNLCLFNGSSKSVRRLKVKVVQMIHVGTFAAGRCKNIVAQVILNDECPLQPGHNLARVVPLHLSRLLGRDWVAVEDLQGTDGAERLAASTLFDYHRKNPFSFNISYEIVVKAEMNIVMGGVIRAKVPFIITNPG